MADGRISRQIKADYARAKRGHAAGKRLGDQFTSAGRGMMAAGLAITLGLFALVIMLALLAAVL